MTDENTLTPREVANTDYRVFDVEQILKHKGNIKNKTNMKFFVKWRGLKDPTWEPWKHIRDNVIFHEYLRQKKMSAMIPKRFETK